MPVSKDDFVTADHSEESYSDLANGLMDAEPLTGNPIMDDPALWGDMEDGSTAVATSDDTPSVDASDGETEAPIVPVSAAPKAPDAKGGKYVLVDPRKIRVNHEKLGRRFARSEADIQDKVDSFERSGQLQAVRVVALGKKEAEKSGFDYDLIFGGTRHAAALRIPGFLLKVDIVKNVSPVDAFTMTIEENLRRNDATPIDDSYNIARFRESFGWDTPKLLSFYGFSASKLSQVERLKGLDLPIQKRVASGMLNMPDALKLGKMPEEDVKALLADVPEEFPRPSTELAVVESNGVNATPEAEPIPYKRGRGRPSKVETQEERNRKDLKAYEASRKAKKQDTSNKINTHAAKIGVATSQRTLVELKAVLNDRDDDVSNAIKGFLSNELNAGDLDAELDRIKDNLAAWDKSRRMN